DGVGRGIRAVVDEDDLDFDPIRRFSDTVNELRDVGSLVVGRDDDRKLHCPLSSHVRFARAVGRPRVDAGAFFMRENGSMTSSSTITMFGADWCGDCRRTKQQLDELGVQYKYVDLVAEPAAADV